MFKRPFSLKSSTKANTHNLVSYLDIPKQRSFSSITEVLKVGYQSKSLEVLLCKQTYKSTYFSALLWTNWTRFCGSWDSDTNIFKNSTWLDLVVLVVKTPPANAGDIRDVGLILGRKDPLEEGMATHSSILAWGPTWTEEPCRLYSLWGHRVRHEWSNWAHMPTLKILCK